MQYPKFLHGQFDTLPDTLAKRVRFIRDLRSIHIAELAHQARVDLDVIESIEAGVETWLSVAVRQRIARVLKIDPSLLEEVEVKTKSSLPERRISPQEYIDLKNQIMNNAEHIKCPICGCRLKTWIQHGFDVLENPITTPKAHCTECTFQLRFS